MGTRDYLRTNTHFLLGYLSQRYLHLPARGYVSQPRPRIMGQINDFPSYFVTELLGTDLHRLLTSRPLEKQFIQYFLYQILVGFHEIAPTGQ